MPSYVIIWQDNLRPTRRVKKPKWVGHAALNIGNHFSVGRQGLPSNYVSWWPSDGAKFSWSGILKSAALLDPQEGEAKPSLPADINNEDYLPDHIIEIPSDVGKEKQMIASWNSFISTRRGSYNNVWQNCSTMVANILNGVGLLPAKRKVWTPPVLHEVISGIEKSQRMTWADMIPIIEHGKEIDVKKLIVITYARSGAYCTTGVAVRYQGDQQWSPQPVKKAK